MRGGIAVAGRCRALAVGLLVLAVAGCAEERGIIGPPLPDPPFDPELAANSIYSLRFAADNAIVAQVRTIAEVLGLAAPPANRAAHARLRGSSDRVDLLRALEPRSLERAVANVAVRRGRGAKTPLFPINFLGKEFIFDASIDAYVEYGDGGPENGVRFELYVVDLSSGLPALPLRPFGFVDLTDESDAVSARLRMRAFDTSGGGTRRIADYLVDGAFASDANGVSVSLLAEGFAEDHNGRFDFELDELLEFDDAAGMTYVTSTHRVLSAEGTEVRLRVGGDLPVDGSHAELLFRMDIDGSAGRTLVDLAVVDGAQAGEIRQAGRVEALVEGTVEAPVFIDAAGRGFTSSELAALNEILFGIDDVLAFAGEAYVPLADLFGY
ncbi:MAG: hypothetical protein OXI39_08905 [Gemmatimonadota bacterium]|uniref:hypothetical protein n=1 Tax=Candidatus Palauibacter scopulicola TaxID=3056741 RepID=UPI0023A2E68C|nr:hypothetical protein [Candidatus Palauibacter scopulicola]MDE2663107.1 hypothetical protein [Candidatus Palauibacter scopulicola]